MKTSLHGYHKLSSKFTCYEVSFMTYSCGDRKSWNLTVRYDHRVFYSVSQLSKATAQNDSRKRLPAVKLCCDISGSCHDLFYSWIHISEI